MIIIKLILPGILREFLFLQFFECHTLRIIFKNKQSYDIIHIHTHSRGVNTYRMYNLFRKHLLSRVLL